MKRSLAFIVVFLTTISASAQQRTLAELVQEQNGPVEKHSRTNQPPVSLELLVSESDVIVRGIVENVVSYLSPDGTDIHTDLILGAFELIYSAEVLSTPRTGTPVTFAVTQRGGELVLNGHRVRSNHGDLPILQPGTNAIFLLARKGDKLFITRDYLGVFALANDRVVPFSKAEWFASQYRGKSPVQFLLELKTMAAKRPQ